MTIRVVVDPEADELSAAFELRHVVFVDEQKVSVELERDGLDGEARHVVVLDGDTAVATGRLMIQPGQAKVQRVAVLASRRGAGLGRLVMDRLEGIARDSGSRKVLLASQVEAIPFYERLGYEAYGERFMEAGILHRWMRKRL